jgi:hypothetical protein
MRAVIRLLGIAMAGIALYYAGIVNGMYLGWPQPGAAAAVVAALAMTLVLLVWITSGTGRDDARVRMYARYRRPLQILWLVASVYAFMGIVVLVGVMRPPIPDETRYHNDAIALNQCAAKLVIQGKNPYSSLDLFACYDELGIGADRTTPLRRGVFREARIYPMPTELDSAWTFRRLYPEENAEFVWRPSYPALSFLVLVPWVLLDVDPNALSLILLLVVMALVVVRTERSLRGLMATALLASLSITAFTVGGTSDLFYAAPLVAAWLWRERRWSAVALGIACAAKQLAWFAAPYYFIATAATRGWREAFVRSGIAALPFVAVNLPFFMADPGAWIAGVGTPLLEPMFARGAGLVFLGTSGVIPLLPPVVYLAMEILAIAASLVGAWVFRHRAPEVGIVLAFVPLFFAWRSLFSYFFLLPLFAAAAVARMPLGSLSVEEAQRGGVSALAISGPRVPALEGNRAPGTERAPA